MRSLIAGVSFFAVAVSQATALTAPAEAQSTEGAEPPPIRISPAPPPIKTRPTIPPPAPPALRIGRKQSTISDAEIDATEETIFVRRLNNWVVFVDPSMAAGCFALVRYDDGTILRIQRDERLASTLIMIGNNHWRSLKDGKPRPIEFRFGGNEPWEGEATAGTITGVHFLSISVPDGDFWREFSQAWAMEVNSGTIDLGLFDLEDSAGALQALATCQLSVDQIIDPFAQQNEDEPSS